MAHMVKAILIQPYKPAAICFFIPLQIQIPVTGQPEDDLFVPQLFLQKHKLAQEAVCGGINIHISIENKQL